MKVTYNIAVAFLICFSIVGCKKYGDDYKTYLDNKEITYPGLAQNIIAQSGNLRAVLVWHPSPDPSITKYVITWNNGANSMTVNATTHDPKETISVSIPNLEEYVYSFKIVAYDSEGHVSIGQELNNVRVYGPAYQATVINRTYNTNNPSVLNGTTLTVNFNKADTTNTITTIKYTNTSNTVVEKTIARDDQSIALTNYKVGTLVQYTSSYKPEPTAADSFNAAVGYIPIALNKALFTTVVLPTDIRSEYGWEIRYLWDNNLGEPGFHTPGDGLPQWFTFDMGVSVPVTSFKMWQRESALYDSGNPKRFEVWGSNNPNSDGSWTSWTKLSTFTSVKPSGQASGYTDADKAFALAGEPFTFPASTPAVRYIRIKVLETWGGTNYFHLIELTFYRIQ